MNLQSHLSLARLRRAKQNRFNPLSSISDPAQVARKLDSFEAGYFKDAVNIFDALEQREDLIRAVVSKRKKAVGREGWTVQVNSNISSSRHYEAEQHATALEHFYQNLRCENALDRSEKGGFKLLCRQMMDAVGKRFAVHEIVWKSSQCPLCLGGEERTALSATFRFVPLSFFENTTGQLRYLDSETAVTGIDLEPGAWMVTVGDGLMMATATAWILKNMTLNDWLAYSDKNGRPGLRAVTGATPDSPEWKALETTLNNILEGAAVVHSSTDDIKVIDLAAGGHIPFPELVDRIDRIIAALWRGADLSTISRDRGYGASLQEKETCALEEDDAEMLTETLNEYVDKWVIRYLFGEGVKPLARVKVLATAKECTTADLQIDEFLYKAGAPLSLQDLLHRYGRALPKPGEPVLQLPLNPNPTPTLNPRSPSVTSVSSVVKSQFPERSSYPESSQSTIVHAHNSEDAHDCGALGSTPASGVESGVSHDSPLSVPSRDSSPSSIAALRESAQADETNQQKLAAPSSGPPASFSVAASRQSAHTDETYNRQCKMKNTHCSLLNENPNSELSVPLVVNDNTSLNNSEIGANSCQLVSPSVTSVPSCSNTFDLRTSEFELLQSDWLQLSPYGDFPHARGLQRVDRTAAETMVAQFNGFRARLGRLFGGAPFYVGHPDLPSAHELADSKAYGWVMQIEAREDGLYGKVKWSEAGLDLLKNAHYKYLSPYWEGKQIGTENGKPVYRPVVFLSVGLTNRPNIPVRPLANTHNPALNHGIPHADPSSESLSQTSSSLVAAPRQSAQTDKSHEQKLAAPSSALPASFRVDSCPFVVRKPLPLANLHTRSITENIALRRGELVPLHNRRQRIHNAVKSKMRLGLKYNTAWEEVKREHHDWFVNDY